MVIDLGPVVMVDAVLILFVLIAVALILGYLTYLPIPFLSYSQGKEKMYGRVSAIKKLKGGMTIEVSLDQSVSINPRLKEGSPKLISARVTSFIYFRRWQKIPKIGEVIVVEIKNRNYILRERSLNWVKSWRRYAGEIPVTTTIKLVDHHEVSFSPS